MSLNKVGVELIQELLFTLNKAYCMQVRVADFTPPTIIPFFSLIACDSNIPGNKQFHNSVPSIDYNQARLAQEFCIPKEYKYVSVESRVKPRAWSLEVYENDLLAHVTGGTPLVKDAIVKSVLNR